MSQTSFATVSLDYLKHLLHPRGRSVNCEWCSENKATSLLNCNFPLIRVNKKRRRSKKNIGLNVYRHGLLMWITDTQPRAFMGDHETFLILNGVRQLSYLSAGYRCFNILFLYCDTNPALPSSWGPQCWERSWQGRCIQTRVMPQSATVCTERSVCSGACSGSSAWRW